MWGRFLHRLAEILTAMKWLHLLCHHSSARLIFDFVSVVGCLFFLQS